MSNEMFVLVLAVGAAAAGGLDPRTLPRARAREDGQDGAPHGIAFVLLQLTPGLGDSPVWIFAGVFLFVLPALVYALLCAIWMLKLAQTALGVSR